ncbi:MAG TPA: hypothetical protein VMS01_04400 [Stellaceae bacterium]|nr:hypothetical protein [Stellaceae bacterium]
MNVAQKIAARFGGLNAMARAGGWPVTTVQHWCSTGFIPAQRQYEVLQAGASLDPPLSPADLISGEVRVAEDAPR